MSEQVLVSGARQWQAGQWLGFGAMDSVAEINAQCLDLLCSTAAGSLLPLPALLASHQARWCRLAPAARMQLAASPYLLADAGFDDEQRWLWPGRRMVRDLRRDLAAPFFVGEHVGDFVRRVLVFGWHLARANRQLARVVLGMTPACAAHVAALQLRDLDWLAQHQPGWVRPRWEKQPHIWGDLLRAADGDDDAQVAQVSLRGLQLLAGGVLAAQRAAVR
ncbi:MAG: hypothetical protein ABI616_00110 [Pseudomonadota bacterium]